MAITVERAAGVFVEGFTFTRSIRRPYVAERIGGLVLMRDPPGRGKKPARSSEWVAVDGVPGEVGKVLKGHPGASKHLCAIYGEGADDAAIRAAYKGMGYRLRATEALMVHDLKRVGRVACVAEVERVRDAAMADRVAKLAGGRQILDAHLGAESPIRAYVARVGEEITGWVRSIVCGGETWCSSMYVEAAWRRRKIATALMGRMLRDDRAAGSAGSVLLASHAGEALYGTLGYRRIGMLYGWVVPG